MSHIDIFQSSRYIDYDYDNECIFGFDADGEDNNMIFGFAKNNNSQLNKLKLKPLHLPIELIGDSWWRNKYNNNHNPTPTPIAPHYYHRTPSPISPQATHAPPPPPPIQRIFYDKCDKFDARATDKRIKLAFSSPDSMTYADTIVRVDSENGELYETHGTHIHGSSYEWKFILHDCSAMIVGLIDADIVGKQKMNVFVDTQSQYFGTLFSNGKTKGKEGCVIQMSYDQSKGQILIKNITNDCNDYGKEIVAVSSINTRKRYKLTVLLSKPSTITMF